MMTGPVGEFEEHIRKLEPIPLPLARQILTRIYALHAALAASHDDFMCEREEVVRLTAALNAAVAVERTPRPNMYYAKGIPTPDDDSLRMRAQVDAMPVKGQP